MPQRDTSSSFLRQLPMLALLVVCGVGLRWYFRDLPNFAPVAAIALFAGYYFRSSAMALAVPLSVMLISDHILGGYPWKLMVTVYAMLGLPVVLRSFLRTRVDFKHLSVRRGFRNALIIANSCVASSVAFFTMTNLAIWWWTSLYDHSWLGLASCYIQAIPFFGYTLLGDLTFGFGLFGAYAVAVQCNVATAPARVAEAR